MKASFARLHLLALLAVLAACSPVSAETPAETDAQFFMLLAHKNMATLGDAYQAMAMVANGDGRLLPAEECRTALIQRKIAREDWGADLKAPCTKGKLAYMVCQALGIKGGLTMRLFGPSQRYCLFECQYLELMVQGATYQNCTGGELVAVVDRADEYLAAKAAPAVDPAAAADQPSETVTEKPSAAAAPVAETQPPAAPAATAPVDKGEPPVRLEVTPATEIKPAPEEVSVPVGP